MADDTKQDELLKWCNYGKHFVQATDEYFPRKGAQLYSYCKECVSKRYRLRAEYLRQKRIDKRKDAIVRKLSGR